MGTRSARKKEKTRVATLRHVVTVTADSSESALFGEDRGAGWYLSLYFRGAGCYRGDDRKEKDDDGAHIDFGRFMKFEYGLVYGMIELERE